jgi:hypothetical protein
MKEFLTSNSSSIIVVCIALIVLLFAVVWRNGILIPSRQGAFLPSGNSVWALTFNHSGERKVIFYGDITQIDMSNLFSADSILDVHHMTWYKNKTHQRKKATHLETHLAEKYEFVTPESLSQNRIQARKRAAEKLESIEDTFRLDGCPLGHGK